VGGPAISMQCRIAIPLLFLPCLLDAAVSGTCRIILRQLVEKMETARNEPARPLDPAEDRLIQRALTANTPTKHYKLELMASHPFKNLKPNDVAALQREIEAEGGTVGVLADTKLAGNSYFTSENGKPLLLLGRQTTAEVLAHERDHFLFWRELRDSLVGPGVTREEAGKIAFRVALSPASKLQMEMGGVAAQMKHRTETDAELAWKDLTDALGYPYKQKVIQLLRLIDRGEAQFPDEVPPTDRRAQLAAWKTEAESTMKKFIEDMQDLRATVMEAEVKLAELADAEGRTADADAHWIEYRRLSSRKLEEFLEWNRPNLNAQTMRFVDLYRSVNPVHLRQQLEAELKAGNDRRLSPRDMNSELGKAENEMEVLIYSLASPENPFGATPTMLLDAAERIFKASGIAYRRTRVRGKDAIVIKDGRTTVLNRFAGGLKKKDGVQIVYDPTETIRSGGGPLGSHYPNSSINYLSHGAVLRRLVGPVSMHEAIHARVTSLRRRGRLNLFHGSITVPKAGSEGSGYRDYVSLDELLTFPHSVASSLAGLRQILNNRAGATPLFESVEQGVYLVASSIESAQSMAVETHRKVAAAVAALKRDSSTVRRVLDTTSAPGFVLYGMEFIHDGQIVHMDLEAVRVGDPRDVQSADLLTKFKSQLNELERLSRQVADISGEMAERMNTAIRAETLTDGMQSEMANLRDAANRMRSATTGYLKNDRTPR